MPAEAPDCPKRFTEGHCRLAALTLLMAAACGGPEAPAAVAFPGSATIGEAHGARVVAVPRAEFPIETTGLLAEVERSIEVGAEVWGVDDGVLSGWTIAFQGGWFPCQTAAGAEWTWGCTYPAHRLVYAAPDDGPLRCRSSVLVHEIGHVVIGDPAHTDPRWVEAAGRATEACLAPAR